MKGCVEFSSKDWVKKRWQNEFENSVLWNGIKFTNFFFLKSYASVPLPKMQIFIKKRKKLDKSLQYQNVGQKLFAQLLRLGKKNDTTSWHNCSTNIDPGAKNDNIRSKQNL